MARQPLAAADDGPDASAPIVTPEIAAEASVWIARLHGPDRSAAMERECRLWQDRSAAHRLAFERCTETWESVRQVDLQTAYATAIRQDTSTRQAVPKRAGRRSALALAAAAMVVAGTIWIPPWLGGYGTGVGEQRLVVLADGSRMSLNTNTRVRVELNGTRRFVSIERGEALFEVAKDPRRPFIVRAGGSEVVAVGTAFTVRYGDASINEPVAVTLIEGQVTVRPAADAATDSGSSAASIVMHPGDRVRLQRAAAGDLASSKMDRPRIDQVVAWKRSEAIFDDITLADAVVEMNRYNRTPIVLLGGPTTSDLRISGLFKTGDSIGFARAVAALHGLAVREHEGRLELAPTQ